MNLHDLSPEQRLLQRKQHLRLDFPYAIGISLGEYRCNRSCRMCPMYSRPPERERYITSEILERACREIGERPISLEVSAYGETFLHPRADEFLFTARKLCPKATIVVATNGTLLDQTRCDKLVDSGIDHLSFSLDAGSTETYQWLCQSSNYDEVCANLERLVATRNRRGAKHLRITTHIIGIRELAHEFDAFVKRWTGLVDQANVRTYGNWAGLVDDHGVTPAETQAIPAERYPCAWLWYATKIEPNGDVSKCFIHVTGEKDPLGNITQQSFESIWKGPRLAKLRELHCRNRYGEIEFCPNCIVWSLFPKFWEKAGFWTRLRSRKANVWL